MQKEEIFKQLVVEAGKIVVVGHTNPDGDAIGSMVAMNQLLTSMGKSVSMVVPNDIPLFIDFLRFKDRLLVDKHNRSEIESAIMGADLIICLDFNDITTRIGDVGEIIERSSAKRVMIDHHQSPNCDGFELVISDPDSSSASYLVYRTLVRCGWFNDLPLNGCIALYSGFITDTGNFTYSHITSDLMVAAGALIERGVDAVELYNRLHNNQRESRMRLMAYLISNNMTIVKRHKAAYITFSLEEQSRFNYISGDVEGVVNMPLAIEGVELSTIFIETTECIKISLRSLAGGVDVNKMARENYTGGGHINAAGAKSFTSMKAAISKYLTAISKF